ncbi:hypothetical protein CEXT_496701 [Caerostris extrusa]|uniref:Uncharacterized protein n=1 Tax=Caerostris extrusa TaxID=172846 RepID=A0AAV4VJH1_CAEEX|nr:hypothetical protein CEXT_496701 [Caerostris extrusa]
MTPPTLSSPFPVSEPDLEPVPHNIDPPGRGEKERKKKNTKPKIEHGRGKNKEGEQRETSKPLSRSDRKKAGRRFLANKGANDGIIGGGWFEISGEARVSVLVNSSGSTRGVY